METLTQKPQNNIKLQITSSIDALTDSQQNQIMKEIKQMLLINQALKLQGSIEQNDITMEEIVAETKATRNKNAEK